MPCDSRIGTAALTVVLMLGAVAPADAQRRFDVFAGGGIVVHDAAFPTVQAGGGVWLGRYLRVSGQIDNAIGLGLLSTHFRLPLSDAADLLVGTTPIWWAPGDLWIAPAAEVFGSARISPRLRVEIGPSVYVGDGGFVHLMGRVVYSFD